MAEVGTDVQLFSALSFPTCLVVCQQVFYYPLLSTLSTSVLLA